jgi:hypothetical protein
LKEPIGGRVVEKEGTALVDFLTIAYRAQKGHTSLWQTFDPGGVVDEGVGRYSKVGVYVQAAMTMTMMNDNE